MPKYGRKRKSYKRKRSTKMGKRRRKTKSRSRPGRIPRRTVGTSSSRLGAPTTFQIHTKRQRNVKLNFSHTQSYVLNPKLNAYGTQNACYFMQVRANGLRDYNITYSGNDPINPLDIWMPIDQSGTTYGPSLPETAFHPSLEPWYLKYEHFVVIGSKVTVSFAPTGGGKPLTTGDDYIPTDGSVAPITAFICKTGTADIMSHTMSASDIDKIPFLRKKTFMISDTTQSATLAMGYSARKFEGVKDVVDNSNLRGELSKPGGFYYEGSPAKLGTNPAEATFFNFGIVDARGDARPLVEANSIRDALPRFMVSVKYDYTVVLKEPSMLASNHDRGAPAATTLN